MEGGGGAGKGRLGTTWPSGSGWRVPVLWGKHGRKAVGSRARRWTANPISSDARVRISPLSTHPSANNLLSFLTCIFFPTPL